VAARRFEARLVVGAESPAYRNVAGSRPPELAAAALATAVGGELVRIEVDGAAAVEDRPYAVGTRHPHSEELRGAVEVGRAQGLRAAVEAGREWTSTADGERERNADFGVEAGFRAEIVRLQVQARRSFDGRGPARYEDTFRQELSFGGAGAPVGLRFEQWLRVSWPDGVRPGRSGGNSGEPPEIEGALALSAAPGRFSVGLRAETDTPIEVSAVGRRALTDAPWDHLTLELEVRVSVDVPALHAEDESGYLEVYGKPGNVDHGSHKRSGHDGGVESQAVDDERGNDSDDGGE
jgi:hypothetical protein